MMLGWGKSIMESSTQLVMLQRQQEAATKQKVYADEWQKMGQNDFDRMKVKNGEFIVKILI